MYDIKQLAQDLKEHDRVQFQVNGWDVEIKVRDEESTNVYLRNHPHHGNMMVNGWYFFCAKRTVKEAIRLANMSLEQLKTMRSDPDGWPQSLRHIWYIKGCHTGHPNETGTGCLFVLIPIINLFLLLIIVLIINSQ